MNQIPISSLTPNPKNPRKISSDELNKLVESIKRDPEFLCKRKVIHDNGVVLGGNQRLAALTIAIDDPSFRVQHGLEDGYILADWVEDCSDWPEEKKQRFILVDNSPEGMSGKWDIDLLQALWGDEVLDLLGFELPEVIFDTSNEDKKQSNKNVIITIEIPAKPYLLGKEELTEKIESIVNEFGGNVIWP